MQHCRSSWRYGLVPTLRLSLLFSWLRQRWRAFDECAAGEVALAASHQLRHEMPGVRCEKPLRIPCDIGSTCRSTRRDEPAELPVRCLVAHGRSRARVRSRNRSPPGRRACAARRSQATPAAGYAQYRTRCRTIRANQTRVAAAATARLQDRRFQAEPVGPGGALTAARQAREWDTAISLQNGSCPPA